MVGCGGGGGGGSSSTSGTGSSSPTTAANSLVATPTNASVKAVVGASAAVAVVFTTNDGKPVSNVQVSNLTQLPAGWSASNSAFACSQAATGNGCMLNLTYQPTAVTSGSVPLAYAYNDDAGIAKSGSVTIPYAATSMDNAVASISTVGQITVAALSAPQPVTVTFTTDDGNQATNLQITSGLSALPAGWSGAGAFSCATFASGSGCQLGLAFAPTTTTAGTITLGYSYADNSGASKSGTVSIPYLATGDNNVVASTAPGGQVVGLVNSGSQAVTVTFDTDNTLAATNFSVTTNLAALPTGWASAASSLSCASVTTGTGCQLQLTYAPTATMSGTLAIGYSFTSSTGDTKTATASIPYTTAPGHTYIADFGGNQILRCAMSAVSGALSNCTSILTVPSPRTVTFHGAYVYVTSYTSNTATVNNVTSPVNTLYVCSVLGDGSFGACTQTGYTAGFSYPADVEFSGNFMYVAQHSGSIIQTCTIDSQGLPATCTSNSAGGLFVAPTSIVFIGSTAFVADQWWVENGAQHGAIVACTVDPTVGTLGGCAAAPQFTSPNPVALTVVASNLYVGSDFGTWSCQAGSSGLGTCTQTNPMIGSLPTSDTSTSDYGIATINGFFYVDDHQQPTGYVWICAAGASGSIGNCVNSGIGVTSPTGITMF